MSQTAVITTGVDANKLWSTFEREGKGSIKWLKRKAAGVASWIGEQINYLKTVTPANIVGGAKALWENLSKGNWNFFKNWMTDAPFVGRAAGVSAVVGGVIVSVVGGAKAGLGVAAKGVQGFAGKFVSKIAASGLGKFLSGVGITLGLTQARVLTGVFNYTEKAYNFDWSQDFGDVIKNAKKSLENFLEDMTEVGGALGRSAARLIFNKMTGEARLEVNTTVLAGILIIDQTIKNDMFDTLSDVMYQVGFILGDILTQLSFVSIRKAGAKLLNKPEWADGGDEPFRISQKVEEKWEKFKKASDIPEWLLDSGAAALGQFISEMRSLSTQERTGIVYVR
ncbi:MAG: hypothetical protein F6K40_26275 [Okeania sp. SIO3I5]|uniref:hypothetical protein n=1 Tax=Okeania sp. SIO3I5 TaxID=2607805 RepID=UPI0013BA3B9B|nr:hypothetical protein [Okeania sp. SIO3I5]NEQ39572.1 hypothetical protein [Okeania sp. SIO3I5]